MATKTVRQLKADADKAAARAAAAKLTVKAAKSQFKQARKLHKIEKKALKQAKRKLAAAREALWKPVARAGAAPVVVEKPIASAKPAAAGKSGAGAKSARAKSAASARKRAPKPKEKAKQRPRRADPMRSAAEVAKSVIERLQSPPPPLPPTLPAASISEPAEALPAEAQADGGAQSVRRDGHQAGEQNGDQGQ